MPTRLAESSLAVDLYDRDFFKWTLEQARQLRDARPAELDWQNLAEEVESLGKSDKRSISSNLQVLLVHLLKWTYQPEKRKADWKGSIVEHRNRINELIVDSPSLRRHPAIVLAREYVSARLKAEGETGLPENAIPERSPFTIEQILDPDFWPTDQA